MHPQERGTVFYVALHSSMLLWTVLCCSAQFCVALHSSMLLCTVPCCSAQFRVALHSSVLLCTVPCCSAQFRVAMHSSVLLCTVLCCSAQFCVALHSSMLLCTVLCCSAQFCVALHSSMLLCTVLCYRGIEGRSLAVHSNNNNNNGHFYGAWSLARSRAQCAVQKNAEKFINTYNGQNKKVSGHTTANHARICIQQFQYEFIWAAPLLSFVAFM